MYMNIQLINYFLHIGTSKNLQIFIIWIFNFKLEYKEFSKDYPVFDTMYPEQSDFELIGEGSTFELYAVDKRRKNRLLLKIIGTYFC